MWCKYINCWALWVLKKNYINPIHFCYLFWLNKSFSREFSNLCLVLKQSIDRFKWQSDKSIKSDHLTISRSCRKPGDQKTNAPHRQCHFQWNQCNQWIQWMLSWASSHNKLQQQQQQQNFWWSVSPAKGKRLPTLQVVSSFYMIRAPARLWRHTHGKHLPTYLLPLPIPMSTVTQWTVIVNTTSLWCGRGFRRGVKLAVQMMNLFFLWSSAFATQWHSG